MEKSGWRTRLRDWLPGEEKLRSNRWLRWLSPWLGHRALWHWSRRGVSTGVALGVFFGLLIPLAQIPITAAAAVVLRANLPVAAASTLITNPVTFAPVYFAAYRLGGWLTGDATIPKHLPNSSAAQNGDGSLWERISVMGKPLLVGLAVMASSVGVSTYLVISLFWRWRILAKRRQRQATY